MRRLRADWRVPAYGGNNGVFIGSGWLATRDVMPSP